MWSYQVPRHSVTSERLAWWCRAKLQMEPGISPELAPAKESEVPSFAKKLWEGYDSGMTQLQMYIYIYIHILDDAYAIIIHLHTWNTTTDVTFTNSSSEAPRNGSELCLTHREESTWLGRWRTGNKDLAVKIVIYPAKMVDLTWFNHQMLIKQIFSRQQRVDQETNYLELHPRNRMCHITHIWLGYISNIIYIIFIYTYIYIYVDYN